MQPLQFCHHIIEEIMLDGLDLTFRIPQTLGMYAGIQQRKFTIQIPFMFQELFPKTVYTSQGTKCTVFLDVTKRQKLPESNENLHVQEAKSLLQEYSCLTMSTWQGTFIASFPNVFCDGQFSLLTSSYPAMVDIDIE